MVEATSETATGTFEPTGKSGGFLRSSDGNYAIGRDDVFVPEQLCRTANLSGGEVVSGVVRTPARRSRKGPRELDCITSIGDAAVEDHLEVVAFEKLTPIDPEKQMVFETPGGPMTMRVIDLLTPIGFGQRGLIVAPPRTGKTILLQQMAQAVAANYPDVYTMVLLVDERPEEVTDMRRKVHGEVIASSSDQDVESHIRLARLVVAKAKRMVEAGRDVFILLDSLTRLGRAFNASIRSGGRIMSGGLDINALTEPKSIFGAARNIEHGGSLTIVASALIETGSRMDEVIFNEFKGTGNMEIMLSREMANRRLWPAIDLNASGTRKEELLLSPEMLSTSHSLRRSLIDRGPVQSMERLLEQLGRFESNAEFVLASPGGSR
ncbi:MAG: transcription termination factor Rho [Planctomycetes bacterium]|nr:transcription termination factor Rho [Planctomycetota bacterium]